MWRICAVGIQAACRNARAGATEACLSANAQTGTLLVLSMWLPSLDRSRRKLLHGNWCAYDNTSAWPEHCCCACAVNIKQRFMSVTTAALKAGLGASARDLYYFLQVAQSR